MKKKNPDYQYDPEKAKEYGRKGGKKMWDDRPAGSDKRKEHLQKLWEGRQRWWEAQRSVKSVDNSACTTIEGGVY